MNQAMHTFMIPVVTVKGHLSLQIGTQYQTAGNAYGQAQNINRGIDSVSKQNS